MNTNLLAAGALVVALFAFEGTANAAYNCTVKKNGKHVATKRVSRSKYCANLAYWHSSHATYVHLLGPLVGANKAQAAKLTKKGQTTKMTGEVYLGSRKIHNISVTVKAVGFSCQLGMNLKIVNNRADCKKYPGYKDVLTYEVARGGVVAVRSAPAPSRNVASSGSNSTTSSQTTTKSCPYKYNGVCINIPNINFGGIGF